MYNKTSLSFLAHKMYCIVFNCYCIVGNFFLFMSWCYSWAVLSNWSQLFKRWIIITLSTVHWINISMRWMMAQLVSLKLDNAIHWINHYPLDSGALLVSLTLMHHLGRSIFFPTPPPPPRWMSRFLPPHFFVGTLWSFCRSLWKRIPTSCLLRVLIHRGGVGIKIMERPLIPWIFHYPVDSAIQRLNNWSLLFRDLCGG